MADPERLAKELDWLEQVISHLKEQARALRAAEHRVAAAEQQIAAAQTALETRDRVHQDAAAAQAQLTRQLETRIGAFERQALELEAATERLRAREREVGERTALLDERALAVSERGAQLDELARDLAERSEVVMSQGRDLERFAERVRRRDAELDVREQELVRREGWATEVQVAAENAAWMLKPLAAAHREGAWTTQELQRFVTTHAAASPGRVDEWRAYLRYLHDFADVDGRLPSSFDRLIEDVFSRPAPTGRSVRRGGGGG